MGAPSKNRLLAIVLLASPAAAAPARLEIAEGIVGCPAENDLRREIGARTSEDVRAAGVSFTVRIRRNGDALAADVVSTAADGVSSTRTIDDGAASCEALVRAAALTIALAVEREHAARDAPPAPPAPLEPAPPPAAAPLTPRLLRDDRFVATASAISAIGLLPRPSAGPGFAMRARVSESLWLSLRGFWLPEGAMPNGTFALSMGAGAAGACAEPFSSTTISAVTCGHLAVGMFDVVREDVPLESNRVRPYVAASVSAGARFKIAGPMHVEAALDAQIPFTRPTFVTAACPPTGFEPPFLALAAWIGGGVSIP